MRKIGLFIIVFCNLLTINTFAQTTPVGAWKSYLSHYKGLQLTSRQGILYNLTERGMFAYNVAENEAQTYSIVEGLTSSSPSTIYYHKAKDYVFIGYENGKIDYFKTPDAIKSLNDIYRNEFYSQKKINEFAESSNQLFVATDFGIVVYELEKFLPKFTISQIANNPIRSAVGSVMVYNNRIWAAMADKGLYSASLDNPNLSDPNIWVKEDGNNNYPNNFHTTRLLVQGANLLALNDNGFWKYDIVSGVWANQNIGGIQDIYYHDGYLILDKIANCVIIADDGTSRQINNIIGDVQDVYVSSGTTAYVLDFYFGLRKWENTTITNVTPLGPKSNTSLRTASGNGELYYAPGGYTADWIPKGNYDGFYYYNSSQGWTINNTENGALPVNNANIDFSRPYYDVNTGKAYIGSWGRGFVVAKNGQMEKYYDCTNSDITYIYANTSGTGCDYTGGSSTSNTRVSGVAQDNNGWLWFSFAYAQNYLMAFNPQTEQFFKTNQSFFVNNAQVIDLLVDDYGGKWALTNNAITIYYDNATPENTADDYFMRLNGGKGQGNLPTSAIVTSFARDLEGNVWIGTGQGIYIMYANNVYDLSKKKLQDADEPIYDGYRLLRTDIVTSIAVDGGNRKWLGTKNGLYLVDADGEKVIHRFTTENSPLLSDIINHISIDASTGEVFISTDLGLQSFRGDAIQASSPCKEVFIFPNPVFSDYTGVVSIQGVSSQSKVKITSITGTLVKELDSNGGMATWDGKDMWGNKVSSGVYLALSATSNGENACIGKFTVVNR